MVIISIFYLTKYHIFNIIGGHPYTTWIVEGGGGGGAGIHVDTRSPKYLLTIFLFKIFIPAIFFYENIKEKYIFMTLCLDL